MSSLRCPHCQTALTATEAAAGTCPECSGVLSGGPEVVPVAESVPPARGRSRLAFPVGLVTGVVLAVAGAGGAWWAWGPAPFPVAERAEPIDAEAGQRAAAELARAETAAREAQEAAKQADREKAATEQTLITVRDRVQAALGQLTAAEKEKTAVEARLQSAKDQADSLERANKDAAARPRPKEPDVRQFEAQKAALDRVLTDARNRLQAIQAQQADADRQHTAAQARLQAVREQTRQAEGTAQRARDAAQQAEVQRAAADRTLADVRNRLQASRDQSAALDRELADKKAKLADRDRALEARKTQLADLDRAIAAKGAKPVDPPPAPPAIAAEPSAVKPKSAFAHEWLVVGPFPDPDRKGHATAYPAEDGPIDPQREFKGSLRWRVHTSPTDYVDLAGLFKTQDPAVGYAVCWVRASRARKVVLSLGSNDGIKVWMNGKLAIDRAVSRSAAPGQDRVTVDLNTGWNELRVKVDNTGGPWGFYLEARDTTADRPLAGLDYRTTPPEAKKR
jgi:hypothetical protein